MGACSAHGNSGLVPLPVQESWLVFEPACCFKLVRGTDHELESIYNRYDRGHGRSFDLAISAEGHSAFWYEDLIR